MTKTTKQINIGGNGAYHMVYSQAGSLEKALAEAVMNSVDAKASRVDISLAADHVVIRDDGVGFDGEAEIERCFGTLCFDHNTDQERARNRKFGRFGAGRCQLWRWCVTHWRTRRFKMIVDVKEKGFSYDFEDGLDELNGCEVTGYFYETLLPSEINQAIEGLIDQVRYEPTPVYVNGDLITCPPSGELWDDENDDAYFKFEPHGGLRVYNMGVLVCNLGGFRYGLSGVVVSKEELKLNLPRNDIMVRECPRWRRIEKVLRKHSDQNVEKKKSLTVDERMSLLRRWGSGELTYNQVRDKPILPVATGRCIRPSTVLNNNLRHKIPVTACGSSEQNIGDSVHRQKVASVLTEEALRALGKPVSADSDEARMGWLEKNLTRLFDVHSSMHTVPFSIAAKGLSDKTEALSDKDLNAREKAVLSALRQVVRYPRQSIHGESYWTDDSRTLRAGESDSVLGWTDGVSYICIERRVLREAAKSMTGLGAALSVLVHEVAHIDSATLDDHAHDIAFYERFETGMESIGIMILYASKHLVSGLKKAGIKPSKAFMGQVETLADAESFGEPEAPPPALPKPGRQRVVHRQPDSRQITLPGL
jgi:hypothetical protein